jgi:diguanylate cyclase (GGDEF)-like protein
MDSKTYPRRVRAELVKLLYQQVKPGLLAETLAAIILFLVLQGFINEIILVSWLLFNLTVCGACRYLLLYLFNRSAFKNTSDTTDLSLWENLFAIGAFLSGISWGAIGSILMVENDLLRQYFEVILLIGITAAANTLYSPIRKIYFLFLMPAFLPLTFYYFMQGGILFYMGILCLAYMMIMFFTSFYGHNFISLSLKLRFQNASLFDHLKKREHALMMQATHDELTKLPNRGRLIKFLNKAIHMAKISENKIAILYLDMDSLKYINDNLGHQSGDKLLIQVAHRLKKCINRDSMLARDSSDEFIIVCPNIENESEAYTIAKKCLLTMQDPFSINGNHFNTSVSIGVNFYSNEDDDAENLIRNADIAMYHAKELGKNNFQRFNKELKNKIQRRSLIETKLRSAIDKKELFLFYQPIASLKTGEITGIEALLRWHPQEIGLQNTAEFIAVAENSGLILSIGEWALREACLQGKKWIDAGITLQLSINLSGRQFKQAHFYEQVCRILEETNFNPHHLSFELTESIIMEDIEKNIEVLHKMRNLGITILIDDFGVGYSSLNYLKRLPVDKLKIDRSFIQDIPNHADDVAIVSAIIALGNALNLKIIAEGVENKEHLLFLIEKECHEIQGYYLSKPLNIDECTDLLVNKRKNILE